MNEVPNLTGVRFVGIGTYVPRQCGIATFSHDLCEAICRELKDERACQFIAVNDRSDGYS
jgi:hypothetical protein